MAQSTHERLLAAPFDARLDAWRRFLLAHSLLTRRLDDDLRAEQELSLAEYDALVQLAQARHQHLRMSQLAERVLLSRSGVTRLVDRLEADGLVSRRSCSSDARGAEAVLTDAGRDRLRRATRTHLRGVQRHFLDVLEPDALAALARALDAVVDGLAAERRRAPVDPDCCGPAVEAGPEGVDAGG